MSESKPTPGPWEMSCDLNGLVYVEPSGRPAETVICDVIARAGHGPVDDEARANACLIAAAPDLLRAAKESLDEFNTWEPGPDEPAFRLIEQLRAAIAKARGEDER